MKKEKKEKQEKVVNAGNKKELPKFFAWVKKHIGLTIFLVIVLVIAIFVTYITVNVKKAMKELQTTSSVAEVKAMDLTKSVSMTGTLEPIDTRTVSAQVNQIKIDSIEVEVGQYVHEGDILMRYDAEDLEKNLADATKEANLDNYKTDFDIIKSARSKEDAQWTHDRLVERYTIKLQNYRNFYNALCFGDGELSGEKILKKHADEYARLNLHEFKAANSEWKIAGENPERIYVNENSTAASLPIHIVDGTPEDDELIHKYKYDYNEVVAVFTQAMGEIEKDYLELINNLDDALADANYNLNVSNMQGEINKDKTAEKLQEAQEDLDDAIVYAPISGIITNICVEEGDKVYSTDQAKTTLCVIQDTSAFKVVGTVDEYDIAKLTTGLSSVVKTDSTGEDEFTAKVTFVGATPDSTTETSTTSSATSSSTSTSSLMGGSSSSSSTSYRVELSLDKFDERLRSGMTGKTSIILQEEKNSLCVPYDCIKTDEESGKKYVNVQKPDGTYERKYVEIILDSDYYVAVKGDIKEGDKIEATEASGEGDDFAGGVSFSVGGPGGPNGPKR